MIYVHIEDTAKHFESTKTITQVLQNPSGHNMVANSTSASWGLWEETGGQRDKGRCQSVKCS